VASGAVHPLDLPIGPWMIDIGKAALNNQILGIAYRTYVPRCFSHWVAREITELDTIVGEDGVYLAPLRQGCLRKSEEVLWFAFSGQLQANLEVRSMATYR